MEELTAKIDRYLSGEMPLNEKESFENEMSSDVNLKKAVDLQMKTGALLEKAAWIETKSKVSKLNNKNNKTIQLRPLLKIASVFIVLLGSSYFFIANQYSDSSLYNAYSTTYPDYLTSMGDSDDDLKQAMKYYNSGEFQEAIKLFNKLSYDSDLSNDVIIYKITCLVELGRADEAIELGDSLAKEQLSSPVQWELILAHLADGSSEGLIEKIELFRKESNGYQESKSKELLEDLNSIWR